MLQSYSRPRAIFVGLSVLAFTVAAVGLWAVPNVLSSSTFAFIATFMIGGASLSLVTWRNAQPTGTVAQLLHATEAASAQRPITHVKAHSESE
jgi:hypothetical protein